MRRLVVLAAAVGCAGSPAAAAEPVPAGATRPVAHRPDPNGLSGQAVSPGEPVARIEGPAGARTHWTGTRVGPAPIRPPAGPSIRANR